jgi:hypothetical protein
LGISCGPALEFSLDHSFRVDFLGFHVNARLFVIVCDERLIIVVVVFLIIGLMFVVVADDLIVFFCVHSCVGDNVVFFVGIEDCIAVSVGKN